MKKVIISLSAVFLLISACNQPNKQRIPAQFTMSKAQLMDKVKGGWAGQTIGTAYGGPTEFQFNGTMIQDYVSIPWHDNYIKWWFDSFPGLFDDVYMDLTFVQVFDLYGLDAHVDSFAMAFARAPYPLWHANQVARYNILNGIMPPASGHWLNNPCADDIDFQIEADFAGLMSPGMPNSASEIADKIGHIMNYGDGWYGGVYVAAMYTLAFISDDIEFIVTQALKTIPHQSKFHQAMSDVIKWHKQYPDDWRNTWLELEKKWSSDIGCPAGVFVPFNIDAIINCAYVIVGLLYGQGDFFRTIDIATRCGQDSDCNPATAGGIIGTMLGYSNIPEYWMKSLREVEEIPFPYMDMTLNQTYQSSFNHALQMIERGGGSVSGDNVTIVCQQPEPVRLEIAFEGHFPVEKQRVRQNITQTFSPEIEFEGIGFAVRGAIRCNDENYVGLLEVFLNGKLMETAKLPASNHARRFDLTWKYQLPKGKYKITFNWLNPRPDATINVNEALIYSDAPVVDNHH